MSPLRRAALLLGGLALVCGGGIGLAAQGLPQPQGDRLEVAGVVGVQAGGSYAWLVPTAHGVLLVDTGMDPTASAILAELGRQGRTAADVHTVLLTHGHIDHTSGGPLFPGARFLVGEADVAIATGRRTSTSPASRLGSLVFRRSIGKEPEAVRDGFTATIDGLPVQAVSVPGHTAGSIAWVVGDVLFAGDALLNDGDGVQTSPWFVSELPALAESIPTRLGGFDVAWMADGHVGVTEHAGDAIEAFVQARR